MAELTQPFLLAGTILNTDASITDWLRTVHIQPRWLDEMIVVSSTSDLHLKELNGLPTTSLIYRWTEWHQSELYFLHQACREIRTGEKRMILLVSESTEATSALVLSSPAAIGIYNQIPLAYLDNQFSQHLENPNQDLLSTLESILEKADKKPQLLDSLSIDPGKQKRPVKNKTAFESATWTKSTNLRSGTISACLDVLNSLIDNKKKNGLVAEMDSAQNLYGIWIERL